VSAGAESPSTAVVYRERLRTPWWWYPVALALASVLAAEFQISGDLAPFIPWIVLPVFALVVTWSLGRSQLEIRDGELRIRRAHVPLEYITTAIRLDQRSLRRLVGRDGDPLAYVSIRPWIGPGVQLILDDADDPTPYWVVSSRHPELVVKVLNERR
jgi:hypothetical protein